MTCELYTITWRVLGYVRVDVWIFECLEMPALRCDADVERFEYLSSPVCMGILITRYLGV